MLYLLITVNLWFVSQNYTSKVDSLAKNDALQKQFYEQLQELQNSISKDSLQRAILIDSLYTTLNISLLEEKHKNLESKLQKKIIFAIGMIAILILLSIASLYQLKAYRKQKAKTIAIYRKHVAIKTQKEKLTKLQENLHEHISKNIIINNKDKEQKSFLLFKKIEYFIIEKQMFRKHSLSCDELAKNIGTNTNYIRKAIKEHSLLNYSFTKYVNYLRIKHAIDEFNANPDIELHQLAYNNGLSYKSLRELYTEMTGLNIKTSKNDINNS